MYNDFYKFVESPFNVTSDPAFFFLSSKHSEAFSHLVYGIKHRKGIILITGEIGTGKTTLCRTLLNYLDPKQTKTAFILNPNFSDIQLLQLILHDLGLETNARTRLELISVLNQFLLKESSAGNNVVVIIDEAQNLKERQLEQIRLLSNLETEKEKLLQIVLVGQPELIDKLRLNSLRQLNQRVSVRYHILPLDHEEMLDYIEHRLKVAQRENHKEKKVKFTKEALDAIYFHSRGTPRLINILCDRALLAGFIEESLKIDEHIIHKCMREVVSHT
ncbi:MAG: hypothetical protein A2Z88_05940 [Omnitrophica WOR_2 bacterium GWA2_47_8]|nr:MAG: hypothetical protein A2Z88_05940 [Omnitrophica WOR_2 bacterium GWA2_47_8]